MTTLRFAFAWVLAGTIALLAFVPVADAQETGRARLRLLRRSRLVPAEPIVSAQTPQATTEEPGADDKQVVDSKATTKPAASSVNFRKELNLPFETLGTLGPRIDTARRKPDPVALAHAASELSVAEKVAGKTASITATQLLQESAELAAVRKQEAELRAVLEVSNQVALANNQVASLKKQLALAQAQTKADKDAFTRNEQPTATPRQVVVNNYTTQYLDIWVNGMSKTQVLPGSTSVITIEHRWNPTVLKAYGNDDDNTWGPRYIWGRFDKYTWNVN